MISIYRIAMDRLCGHRVPPQRARGVLFVNITHPGSALRSFMSSAALPKIPMRWLAMARDRVRL